MIILTRLTKRYPGNAEPTLKDITLTLPSTGLCYLIGKSGAGKSTLLSLIGGMDNNYEGSLQVDGKELKTMTEKEKACYRFEKIAFVFQNFKADDEETVEENLRKALSITDLRSSEVNDRIQKTLRRLGLEDKTRVHFKNLSGGEKKRISLARALIRDCPILLADEPLASLSPPMRRDIGRILSEEAHRRLVVIITHEVNEIPPEAEVAEIVNGHLSITKNAPENPGVPLKPSYQRKKYQGIALLRDLLSGLRAKRRFLMVTLSALIISLFSVTFSFLLSSGVSRSLTDSLAQYMDKDSFVIRNREESVDGTGYETADAQALGRMKASYPSLVSAVSSFYLSSLDAIFQNQQEFTFNAGARSFVDESLSLDDFLQARTLAELPEGENFYGQKDIGEEDIILGADESHLRSLYLLVFQNLPVSLDEKDYRALADSLTDKKVFIDLKVSKNDWGYHLEHSFAVRGFVRSDTFFVAHPKADFNEHFVTGIMHFKEIFEEDSFDEKVPWALKKCLGLRLFPKKVGDFLTVFLKDSACDPYALKTVTDSTYYRKKDPLTHNRVRLYKDFLPKVSVSAIEAFVQSHADMVRSVSYSSPIYTYTASGYISGFRKPFFFSRSLEKLNAIEDNGRKSDIDLGEFQTATMEVPAGVIKADLLSSASQDGLGFVSLGSQTEKPWYGKVPSTCQEIGISSRLAQTLFPSISSALEENLYALTLEKTEQEGDHFINRFSEGILKITGVYDDDRKNLYHDSLFPLAYCFCHTSLEADEIRITEAVLKVDLTKGNEAFYQKAIHDAGDFLGSFPMKAMIDAVQKSLRQLSTIFLIFSLLALGVATFLLGLSFFLILRKDRKKIGILLSLGYQKKEITSFYFRLALLLNLSAFGVSSILSLLTERILSSTLNSILSSYSSSIVPYTLSFLLSLTLATLAVLFLKIRLKKMSPKDAFLRQ